MTFQIGTKVKLISDVGHSTVTALVEEPQWDNEEKTSGTWKSIEVSVDAPGTIVGYGSSDVLTGWYKVLVEDRELYCRKSTLKEVK